jgi:sulfate adenylyltransferase subunit 2
MGNDSTSVGPKAGVSLCQAQTKSSCHDEKHRLSHLDALEAESIHILREVAAEFSRPAMLYSIGKDSSVLLRLAQKAFFPAPIPFPLLHIDTTFKFKEMIEFRDRISRDLGLNLIVHTNKEAIAMGANPFRLGTTKCCSLLKTKALLDALQQHGIDAAIGGARRDEEKSRAKERIFSFRDAFGQWDPKNQRPEVWNLYNSRIDKGQCVRVFPLSNWTELDVWQYIQREEIPVVSLYFAKKRAVMVSGEQLIVPEHECESDALPAEGTLWIASRMRSLGCTYCSGAIRSTADSLAAIIDEVKSARRSERENRLIDHDQECSMELKKREGYF